MDEEGFISFMRKKRKTESIIASCLENAITFEKFLKQKGTTSEASSEDELDNFVSLVLDSKMVSKFMWTLQYYFEYIDNPTLLKRSRQIRAIHTAKRRRPFKLKDFKDVGKETIRKLSEVGIHDIQDMLDAAKTKQQRTELSKKTGIDLEQILELAKLSSLTRLGGVKSVRARLYHDSGFDTIGKIADTTADELIRVTCKFIRSTGFDGIPPTPKEAENTVNAAKKTPRILEL